MSTAASSGRSLGTGCSWLSWATKASDQPPPVSWQYPVCSPGAMWPPVRLTQWRRRPCGTSGAHGLVCLAPRSRAPARSRPAGRPRCRPRPRGRARTGSSRWARTTATNARPPWPGRSHISRTAAATAGASRDQGSSGGSTSTRRSGPKRPPAPALHSEAMRAMAKRGTERSTWRAFISPLDRCGASFWLTVGPKGSRRTPVAGRPGPVLDVPTPLAGDAQPAWSRG